MPCRYKDQPKTSCAGANAQGEPPTVGGSAFVPPSSDYTSEIVGIRAKLGTGARVDYIAACVPDPSTAAWQHVTNRQVSAGLVAEYFNSLDFSGPSVTRVESELNIDMFSTATVPVSNASNFSAVWTGQLPISWEKRLQDNPAYASLPVPGAPNTVNPANNDHPGSTLAGLL